jgi:hypothetical protein
MPSPAKKKSKSSSPDKKKSVSSEKVKRTRSKPAISRKKQESLVSGAGPTATTKTIATKTSATKTNATKTSATKKKAKEGQSAKKGAIPSKVKRTYVKKTAASAASQPPEDEYVGPTAYDPNGIITMPTIRPDVILPWAMKGETFPSLHPNDVLSGRGNGVAIYPGNRQFRDFIRMFKDRYVRAYRNEKGTVAADVIRTVLSLDPPGRFVEKANKNGTEFQLVDYSRALEKTSQALREGSAALRVMVFKDVEKGDKARALERQMSGGVMVFNKEIEKARTMDRARAMDRAEKARAMNKANEWVKGKVEEKGPRQG